MIQHQGECHCGRVRFEMLAPAVINVSQCNCSVCSKSGFLGMIVPRDRFTLKSGEESLTEHTFDSGVAKHPALRRIVARKLRYNWSPEQIAGWLKRENPTDEHY